MNRTDTVPSRIAIESPNGIYEAVREEIGEILQALEQPSQNGDLASAIETARGNFQQLLFETDETLRELEKDVEWDAFTIAFYGETNAGKSTIIETLRILMGEKFKLEQQRKFRETRERFGVGTNAFEEWEEKERLLVRLESDLRNMQAEFTAAREQQAARELELSRRAEKLSAEIRAMPFLRRFLSFVWKIPSEAALDSVKTELGVAFAKARSLSKQQEENQSDLLGKIHSLRRDIAHIELAKQELAACEDGLIIGDGQSDFTRESSRYEFEVNAAKFVLLDVPGIEGKEALVREPIMQAVRKAHAVFYVTRKAVPPQKGDEKTGGKGTLEKIKEHLGAQTEVWAIFNKSIKSAEQLRMQNLVNEGERKSLDVLEEVLSQQLGEHYAGLLPVSAYAAFVASTEHFVPGSAKAKDRGKFLKAIDADAIHHKTGFRDLIARFTTEMTEQTKLKIRKSNFNKANVAVLRLKDRVDLLNKKRFFPLHKRLQEEAHASKLQLDSVTDAFLRTLESKGRELIDVARSQVRADIYRRIDDDMDNNELEPALRSCLDLQGKELEIRIHEAAIECRKDFLKELEDIADQFRDHVDGILSDASRIDSMKLDLRINIDNGIRVGGLAGVAMGAVALWWNPGGWVLGVIAVVGLAWPALKAVWGYFDNDYKKAQQKENANENLSKVFRTVKSNFAKQLQGTSIRLLEKLKDVKHDFELPALQAKQIGSSLTESSKRLKVISYNILKKGDL
ncbi:MAG: hypothetical protein JSR26_00135 [Proteobacteria bacterium]|nr:hypothetical protein [Pseudomonadota bacterium]